LQIIELKCPYLSAIYVHGDVVHVARALPYSVCAAASRYHYYISTVGRLGPAGSGVRLLRSSGLLGSGATWYCFVTFLRHAGVLPTACGTYILYRPSLGLQHHLRVHHQCRACADVTRRETYHQCYGSTAFETDRNLLTLYTNTLEKDSSRPDSRLFTADPIWVHKTRSDIYLILYVLNLGVLENSVNLC
jgi:hypothetical protein